ncbi:MAG: hypothetical protein PHF84_07000 [bacterium]|nr:hypothetical protein [bacterium]
MPMVTAFRDENVKEHDLMIRYDGGTLFYYVDDLLIRAHAVKPADLFKFVIRAESGESEEDFILGDFSLRLLADTAL